MLDLQDSLTLPNAAKLFLRYKVNPTSVNYVAMKVFNINDCSKEVVNCFARRTLLYWSGDYILKQMKHGVLFDEQGDKFYVQFVKGLTRGKILAEEHRRLAGKLPSAQYALSFRITKPDFNCPNFVLIKRSEPN